MTTIPTIQDLYNNILASLEATYSITINDVGHNLLEAKASVLAAQLYMNYLAVGDVQKNVWPDTADSVENGGTLERFGVSILGRWPDAAVAGVYEATVTGTVGAVIPGTTVFKSDNTATSAGKLFQIQGGDFTLASSPDTITIIALAGGTDSVLEVGDTLTSTSPLTNVTSQITISAVTTDPVDAEDIEEYRTKILEKILLEPGSWSAVDYRLVGLNVTGVGQTYAYNKSGASGEVDVYLQGNTPVASPGPSASPTVVSDYETALDLVLPLGVWQANVASSTIRNIAITITMGSFSAFTVAQKADIEAALSDFVNNVHPFIAAADDVADRNDTIATYNLTSVVAQAVPGYGFSGLTFTVAGTPETEWIADNGEIPFLVTPITYA